MTYQKKYYFSFKDIRLTERTHLVELWQNTEDVLVAEEIKGHMNPFSVEMPELDHKFQVVRGFGCQINLLSETDMKFYTGLYHVNPTDFMIKHYIDSVINYLGYLNDEMMSEPYDIDFNYQVSLTGNDGFSLMDRFSFIQVDETNYTGVKSKFELLQIIFAKIGLPFTEYRIALSTTFTGYSGDTDSTILHESYIDCSNFYDEDDKPMSLRAVVESILAPYGAYIRAESGNIYITDIHSIASLSSVTYKQFTMATGAYAGAIAIPNVKAISDIGYMGTGHGIERSGGVNRQVIAYSPYPIKTVLEESLIGTDEFETVPATWSTKDGYNYKNLVDNDYWALVYGTFEISYFENEEDSNIYIWWARSVALNIEVAYLKNGPYLNITGASPDWIGGGIVPFRYTRGVKFLITGDILVKTKDNPYDDSQNSKDITGVVLTIVIKVGNKYYGFGDGGYKWRTDPVSHFITTRTQQNGVIADKFVPIGVGGIGGEIPVFNPFEELTLDGNFEFEIWSEYKTRTITDANYIVNTDDVLEIWIKNLSIKIVNLDGSDIQDNDIEYIGLLDRTFQNEGEKITLTCGTDTQFADRGKILKSDGINYSDILEWTRNAQSFKIEELLLGSVSSNYRAGFVTLTNMRLKNTIALQNILTDTFIGTAKMMVKSAMVNYQDNVFKCDLIEVLPDELIIVKDTTVT